jgi:outer membrane lipoprotein-sorting protein
MQIHSRLRASILLLILLPLTGCLLGRTRILEPKTSTAVLKTANLQQLINTINTSAAQLQTINATVEIDSSVGGQKKGQITDNPAFTGYLLLRKPDMLRLIGLVPVLRNHAFEMVSNGQTFAISIPSKSQFITGSNLTANPALRAPYNSRPQHILDALLFKAIDPQNDIAVLEEGVEIVKDSKSHKEVEQEDYVVLVISKDQDGPYLSRKIVFNRESLQPDRQLIYDRQAQLVTDARYDNYQDYNGVPFPNRIELDRPVEEYSITLTITKMTLNEPLEDKQFDLPQPPGYQRLDLDDPATVQDLSKPKTTEKEKKQKSKPEQK